MARTLSLSLYNSLTRRPEPVVATDDGHVRVYCCGPTTYDVSHAGHGRTAILPDLLVRHLRASGLQVTYVRNITDVDDKIVKRAKERGEPPLELSDRFASMYQEDVARLGCAPPDHEPRVSRTIDKIIEIIQTLLAKGAAYVVPQQGGGDVWYSVKSFDGYGKLSGRSVDELKAGEGLEERGKALHEGKRDPLDFALWKHVAEGEWGFDSPWGKGRPGWHIECSAMVEQILGFGIEVHAGGMDLIFPHHENEIAQSEAAHPGEGPFAKVWVHGGFLNVDKEKMAKSLGNFVTMRDCYARNDPEALRMFLLSAHYRGPVEFETNKLESGRVLFPGLDEAEARVDYLYTTLDRLDQLGASGAADAQPSKELEKLAKVFAGARAEVARALDDDLNAPVALSAVQQVTKAANDLCDMAAKRRKDTRYFDAASALAREAAKVLRSCTDVLGLLQSPPADYFARTRKLRLSLLGVDEATIDAKVKARTEARAAKDFARSDELRKELEAMGIELYDSPSGTTWKVLVKKG